MGALTDLAEVAAPELEKEKRESGPAEAPIVVGNAAGPLGVPRAPVVGRLIEADKEAAEIVKTEEDEKKEEEATPGVRELKAEETGSENKEGGEVADEPKKKKKRRHKTQGSGQKDQNRKKKEKKEKEVKKEEKAKTPTPEEEVVEEPPTEAQAESPPIPPEVPAKDPLA